jgi:diacylglycerol O-acyltransferase / wax synthase
MDRTRPLWEVYVIDGLQSGRWALLTKYHHATIDGASEQLMLQIVTDPDPDAPPPGRGPSWEAEPLPGNVELLWRTMGQLARNPFKATPGTGAHCASGRRRRRDR